MKPIEVKEVQKQIEGFFNKDVYIHLETTNGAYAVHTGERTFSVGAYIRNTKVRISTGKITGNGPYRVGLKTELGWIYAEGITDWVVDEKGRLLMAGHEKDGKLGVALQLSNEPF
ncbi:YojF family protein [Aneurinibacillus sp. Ricciae_BoGa-3]|uniref:YojF family protein n=1 Tax=Aneurinibacillus sp. Ricciae_BoGa-3 TaxID=3022697 RepID=UPI0023411A3E|nr:YojF family protein [Aneurinibacillus sp. Ricciae_BoGa-3]WCK52648.1 YojF family protein [Aneurinibacillus sp. Ricciae_BoGa-3]